MKKYISVKCDCCVGRVNGASEREKCSFEIMDEAETKDDPAQHNNYLKLTAYRKNDGKHPDRRRCFFRFPKGWKEFWHIFFKNP